jgi:hypothetical protein
MNTITEARHEISSSEAMTSTSGGPKGSQPKPGPGQLWLAIVALVAVVGLGVAVAVGAFDSSSEANDVSISSVDPRLDADFHREASPQVAATSPAVDAAAHPQAWEELASSAAVEQATHPQAWEELATSAAVDPRMDSDFHREATPPAAEADTTENYVNSGLDPATQLEIYEQSSNADPTVDPRLDSDFHREAS